MHIGLLLLYGIFSLLVAYVGRHTTIGFWGVLLMSIFLSPLVTAILYVLLKPR